MADLELKIKVDTDSQNSTDELNKVAEETTKAGEQAVKSEASFIDFGKNSILSMTALAQTILSVTVNLISFAKAYLGITVNIETTSTKLKVFNFIIQNTRKEFSISLGFLSKFADYLNSINFPFAPLTRFIDLMGEFRVVIGIGNGEETLFQYAEDGIKKAAVAIKDFKIYELKNDIRDAAISLGLFAVQAAAAFKSLQKGIARESAFAQASRTIEGTSEEIAVLKTEIERLAATDLAVPVEELYTVAGVAGAMGKSASEIKGFLQIVSEGAVALDISAADLAEKLGTIQTQLNLTDEGLNSFNDQVNIVADSLPGKVKEMDIFEILSMGAATAGKNFGFLKGETVALSGTLLSLGEAPETARTALINLLSSLQNAKNQTPEFQQGLSQLGTSAIKLADDIKAKPMPTLVGLLEKMNGLSKAARLDLATKFLGKGQDANALAKLVDNVDLLKTALSKATDETQYSGSVHAAYAKQIATADAKLILLKNSVNNLAESLTTPFLPAINLAISGITKLSNAATEFSQNHPIFKTLTALSLSVLSVAGALRLLKGALTLLGIMPYLRTAIAGAAGLVLAFNTLGISGVAAILRTAGALARLRVAIIALFGGTIGFVIGGVTLLITAIANILPMTVKLGDTTATVGQIIKATFNLLVAEAINLKNTLLDFFGISKDFEEIKTFFAEFGSDFNLDKVLQSLLVGLQSFFNHVIGTAAAAMVAIKNLGIIGSQSFTERVKAAFNDDYLSKIGKNIQAEIKKIQGAKVIDKKDVRAKDTGSDLADAIGKEQLDAQKKQIDLIAKLNKEQRDREIQAFRDKEEENIRTYQASGAKQTEIDAKIFAEKLKTNQAIDQLIKKSLDDEQAELKKLADTKHNFTNEELTAKKEALNQIETAYRAQIKTLNDLEKDHRDKAIQAQRDIENLHKTAAEKIREIERAGMSDYQLQYDKELEIAQKTAEMKTQIKRGEFAAAAESGKKLQEITSAAAMDAAKMGKETGESYQGTLALAKYRESIQLTEQALKGLKAEENSKANQAGAEGNIAKAGLATVTERINALDNALRGKELKIIADIGPVTQLKAELDKIPAVTEKKIHISYDANGKPIAWSDLITNLNVNSGAKGSAISSQSVNTKNTQATVVSGGLNVTVNANGLSTIEPTIKKWAVDAVIAKINQENKSNQ